MFMKSTSVKEMEETDAGQEIQERFRKDKSETRTSESVSWLLFVRLTRETVSFAVSEEERVHDNKTREDSGETENNDVAAEACGGVMTKDRLEQ
jgi:hypothetical protein